MSNNRTIEQKKTSCSREYFEATKLCQYPGVSRRPQRVKALAMPDPRKYVFIQSPNRNFADVDRVIYYQVTETFDLPEKKQGQLIVVIHDLYKARLGV